MGGTLFCNAYVTGRSDSTDFPTTADAFQKTIGGKNGRKPDAFVAKLSADGWALDYSTYLGGRQSDYGYGIYWIKIGTEGPEQELVRSALEDVERLADPGWP